MTKALFVEDEPRGVKPYFAGLKRRRIECELAQNFDDALFKLQRNRYDIISLDLNFARGKNAPVKFDPLAAGLKLLELIRGGKIRNCPPNMVIIVLTASSNSAIEKRMKMLDVFAFLTKPIDYRSVMRAFEKARRQVQQQTGTGCNHG